MTSLPESFSLIADVGGTNTRVGLARGTSLMRETIKRFRNTDFGGLEDVLQHYLAQSEPVSCQAVSVAIAGPVRDGQGTLTNLNWTIDEPSLKQATHAETAAVLNDLQAQGFGLDHLAEGSLRTVISGPTPPEAASQIVINVGTGFNIAPVHQVGPLHLIPAAEAGHVSLPVRSEEDLHLARYLETFHGFASVEDVLSGRGFERLYAWCRDKAGLSGALDAAGIMGAFEDGGDALAEEAVAVFVRFLGRVSGDLALDHLPFGGIYLSGGVSRAMAPYLERFAFADAFSDKGRFSDFMADFSVYVIEDDYAALSGAAANLARRLES